MNSEKIKVEGEGVTVIVRAGRIGWRCESLRPAGQKQWIVNILSSFYRQ